MKDEVSDKVSKIPRTFPYCCHTQSSQSLWSRICKPINMFLYSMTPNALRSLRCRFNACNDHYCHLYQNNRSRNIVLQHFVFQLMRLSILNAMPPFSMPSLTASSWVLPASWMLVKLPAPSSHIECRWSQVERNLSGKVVFGKTSTPGVLVANSSNH